MIIKPSIIYDSLPESALTEAPEDQTQNLATDTQLDNMTNTAFDNQTLANQFDSNLDEQPSYTLTDIGKIYALKKIYSTLNSLRSYISRLISENPNVKLTRIQDQLNQLTDLFTLVTDNLDKYVKKLDKIIDLMERYIKSITKELQLLTEDNNED